MHKKQHAVFINGIYGTVTAFALTMLLYTRSDKDKNSFNKIYGEVVYLEYSFGAHPMRNAGKYKYLKLNSHRKVFELFTGKDFGDFKPNFDKVESLSLGD